MLTNRIVRVLAGLVAGAALVVLPHESLAQGRGRGGPPAQPPGLAKKQVSTSDAVVVVRDVLVKQGYVFVRLEQAGPTQVVYYRRGNMGRGRGQGPVEKMVVRPTGTVVTFEAGPKEVIAAVRIRLGL